MATKVIETHRNKTIEDTLAAHLDARGGVPRWRYVEAYSLDDIERKQEAQSRITPVDKQQVAAIAVKLQQGETFPPIILWETADNGIVLIDGNHRALGSVKAKHATTPAYLVHLDNTDEAVYLSAVFNGQNGRSLSKDEVRRAVIAAKRRGVTETQIARDFGVARQTVRNIVGESEGVDRANRLAVPTEGLSRSHIRSLNRIEMDKPFIEATRLAQQAALDTTATNALVKAVSLAPKTEDGQLAAISAERDARLDDIASVAVGRKSAGSPFSDLRGVLATLTRVRESYPEPSAWVPRDPSTVKAWLPQVEEFAAFARSLAEEYRTAAV